MQTHTHTLHTVDKVTWLSSLSVVIYLIHATDIGMRTKKIIIWKWSSRLFICYAYICHISKVSCISQESNCDLCSWKVWIALLYGIPWEGER